MTLMWVLSCTGPGEESAEPFASGFSALEESRIVAMGPLPTPPADPTNRWAEDPAAAHLGQWLFFDTRFSRNGEVACATCHDPEQGFGDGKALAEGIEQTERHAPSIWNTTYNRWHFWDGRADSHWAQALAPLEAPTEHGGNRLAYAHLLHDDADLNLLCRRAEEDGE